MSNLIGCCYQGDERLLVAEFMPNDTWQNICFIELSSQQEYLKLKARYEALQRTQRNLLGEDLDPLKTKELVSLERQLDMSLTQIRSTRVRDWIDRIARDLKFKRIIPPHFAGPINASRPEFRKTNMYEVIAATFLEVLRLDYSSLQY